MMTRRDLLKTAGAAPIAARLAASDRVKGKADAWERPVSIPDFHATIHSALGINPAKNLFAGERPVPITDQGKPLVELFG